MLLAPISYIPQVGFVSSAQSCNRSNVRRHNDCEFLTSCQIAQFVRHTWMTWRQHRPNPPIIYYNTYLEVGHDFLVKGCFIMI